MCALEPKVHTLSDSMVMVRKRKRKRTLIFVAYILIIGGSLELPMWLTDGFLVTFFWKVVGSCAHTRESRTATIHGTPYTVHRTR